MIIDRLQLQFASQTGLRVDDNQLDKTIERIAGQNKLDIPAFKKALLGFCHQCWLIGIKHTRNN
jgi:peptidyl-prolyl cis-trans isomerase SurA